jgi:hypothetical protein
MSGPQLDDSELVDHLRLEKDLPTEVEDIPTLETTTAHEGSILSINKMSSSKVMPK